MAWMMIDDKESTMWSWTPGRGHSRVGDLGRGRGVNYRVLGLLGRWRGSVRFRDSLSDVEMELEDVEYMPWLVEVFRSIQVEANINQTVVV